MDPKPNNPHPHPSVTKCTEYSNKDAKPEKTQIELKKLCMEKYTKKVSFWTTMKALTEHDMISNIMFQYPIKPHFSTVSHHLLHHYNNINIIYQHRHVSTSPYSPYPLYLIATSPTREYQHPLSLLLMIFVCTFFISFPFTFLQFYFFLLLIPSAK